MNITRRQIMERDYSNMKYDLPLRVRKNYWYEYIKLFSSIELNIVLYVLLISSALTYLRYFFSFVAIWLAAALVTVTNHRENIKEIQVILKCSLASHNHMKRVWVSSVWTCIFDGGDTTYSLNVKQINTLFTSRFFRTPYLYN